LALMGNTVRAVAERVGVITKANVSSAVFAIGWPRAHVATPARAATVIESARVRQATVLQFTGSAGNGGGTAICEQAQLADGDELPTQVSDG